MFTTFSSSGVTSIPNTFSGFLAQCRDGFVSIKSSFFLAEPILRTSDLSKLILSPVKPELSTQYPALHSVPRYAVADVIEQNYIFQVYEFGRHCACTCFNSLALSWFSGYMWHCKDKMRDIDNSGGLEVCRFDKFIDNQASCHPIRLILDIARPLRTGSRTLHRHLVPSIWPLSLWTGLSSQIWIYKLRTDPMMSVWGGTH